MTTLSPRESDYIAPTVTRHPNAKARFALIDKMRVEQGTKEDWDALHHLHYKAESLPIGPHFWRCVTEDGDLVGIVVTSVVGLLLKPRHEVFPKLKPGGDTSYSNRARAKWLNANMRRDARIVTDTMYRGVGVSYRMVNLANRLENVRFIEIQSSMSKFNPFDLKAGFRHAHLNTAAAYEKGIAFLREAFEAHPADHQAIVEEFNSLKPPIQRLLKKEMAEFYYRHSAKEKTGSNLNAGTSKVENMPFSTLLKELQQLVFATPVYGIWKNPDLNRNLPESLPLRAYDLQKPNEPLNLSRLKELK